MTTENLLSQLEEKMLSLLAKIEDMQKYIDRLKHENNLLNAEKNQNEDKLRNILSLFKEEKLTEPLMNTNVVAAKPVLIQG